MRVKVDWDTDGQPLDELGLETEVFVQDNVEDDEVADWLSEQYGWLVNSWSHI